MKDKFIEKNFRGASLQRVEQANEIMQEYDDQGYELTLRQLYYQFVARGLIENSIRSYKNLGAIINDGRMAGMVDWDHIVDRTRSLQGLSTQHSPSSALHRASYHYREDKWINQPNHIEVWVEKEALAGVVWEACRGLQLDYFAAKGYASASSIYAAAQRFHRAKRQGKKIIIFYLGDFDPSGLDMDRDIRDRLSLMRADVRLERIALTWEQVQHYDPPPNPAKTTDSRAADYIATYGDESWELDALEPAVLVKLIRDAVEQVRDDDLWVDAEAAETQNKRIIEAVSNQWDEVVEFLRSEDYI